MDKLKRCRKCKEEKSLTKFYKNKNHKDGFDSKCKQCISAYNKLKYEIYKKVAIKKPVIKVDIDLIREKRELFDKFCSEKNMNDIVSKKMSLQEMHIKSRNTFYNYLNSGILIKPDKCSICRKPNKKIFAHHEDYSKPLVVIYCCLECHKNIHNNKLKGKNLERFNKIKLYSGL